MHVVVIGAGAVGGYFGARLAQNGIPVTFLVRERRRQQLAERGLRVRSVYGDIQLSPQLAVRPEDIASPGLVLLAVKQYHLEGALPQVQALARQGAYVLPLLNGIRHLDALRSVVPPRQLLGGLCHIEATLDASGDVVHTSQLHDITYGPLAETDAEALPAIDETLQGRGFIARRSEQVLVDMWIKYICLSTLSGLTASTRKPIGAVREDGPASRLMRQFAAEAAAVARAECPEVPSEAADQAVRWLERLPASMTSSMHRDLEKGLPIEIESIQGVLVELAERHGIDTPAIRTLYAVLHPHREGAREPAGQA
ncbi:ketopantoate reductase family protein [Alicyclobacillus macrosporangiidus]|uniref:ketopantoate reductase family protein n=1 Tax=Alicyclobacillus macrosporangiidus TaxID=392015 RepID=UPI000497C0FA|nr:2-dehydropantoate 2-reductase [Alicyclobacillus macrosporangiidus]MCL6597552.1 2-dehydropantoate 2-reductase [Alicyclobacillus macrosporangiidus]